MRERLWALKWLIVSWSSVSPLPTSCSQQSRLNHVVLTHHSAFSFLPVGPTTKYGCLPHFRIPRDTSALTMDKQLFLSPDTCCTPGPEQDLVGTEADRNDSATVGDLEALRAKHTGSNSEKSSTTGQRPKRVRAVLFNSEVSGCRDSIAVGHLLCTQWTQDRRWDR